jgi:cellulose synthase operon protein C
MPLHLHVGTGGANRVFWNGVEIGRDDAYRGPYMDRDVYAVGAHAGENRLAIKVCVERRSWGLFARLTLPDGSRAAGVEIDASTLAATPSGHGVEGLTAPKSDFRALMEAAQREGAQPSALEHFARYLSMTAADDPAENLAEQLARRAANEGPTLERLQYAAALARQRGETMKLVAQAMKLYPKDPRAWLLDARLRATSFHPPSALPLLAKIPGRGREGVIARILRADVYEDMGLHETALVERQENAKEAEEGISFLRQVLRTLGALDRDDEAHAYRKKLLALQYDDVDNRKALLARALFRGDHDEVRAHLAAIVSVTWGRTGESIYTANVLEAMEDEDGALAVLRSARELVPHEPGLARAEGQLLQRMNRDDEAKEAYRAVLALRPQDAVTRELLEQMESTERPDEAFAAPPEALLARRLETSGYATTVLQDLTVQTVHENGLGSVFRQVAVQIHTEDGARSYRGYPIVFTPGSQRVDVRMARVFRKSGQVLEGLQSYTQSMGEPWYRLYYDTRQLVIVFPDLEPGDTIEIRYRIDDVSHRNMFADYFGDISFLQSATPLSNVEHIFMLPKGRKFHFNQPKLAGLKREESRDDGQWIVRYSAKDVPALKSEGSMPGRTEIVPYLHVSTYETWEAVGKWYWGLIKDQLYADDALKKTVRDLVKDAPDLEAKVRRIHDWVLDNTRYVGLEFGIHGFKPYRVPDIVKRGFGDCKDKASLLFTMFREAGIDAHIVLIRTRQNGAIEDLPASLAVFDHAIAYVPELDLYLDGTAEHSGLRELPAGDQGVSVLHVWAGGSRFARTPVDASKKNATTRAVEMELAVDGSAEIKGRETIVGVNAAGYRSRYQAEGTQKERLERRTESLFPGAELQRFAFGGLGDRNADVTVEYDAKVPRMASRAGETLRLPTSSISGLSRSLAPTARREHPLDLGVPSRFEESWSVRLPAGMRVEHLPENAQLESKFGKLSLTVESRDGTLRFTTRFQIDVERVSPADYPKFREWIERIDQVVQQKVTLGGSK